MTVFDFATTPFLIAGPCLVESEQVMLQTGEALGKLGQKYGIPVCFKASFDKANRARGDSPRGPGMEEGLRLLERVRQVTGLPLLTDIHESNQAAPVAEVVDVLQIPAFLSRQTDLLLAAGRTGRPVNIKRGQWMAPDAMAGAVEKVRQAGATAVGVTERGTFFGYGDLVVDFRNLPRMRQATGAAVIFDATHSVQQPGQGHSGSSGGLRQYIPALLRAAAAVGVDGFFIETHPNPAAAHSDAATQWPLDQLDSLLGAALAVRRAAAENW